ncbi:MAG: DUF2269 domain-containing protein [Corynebacterium sp.]|nr:DUF2269 domain-containing protein [Corynebacterium sp.]
MTSLLIALHIIAAVLLLGPVTVAVSTYQIQMIKASQGDQRSVGAAETLHRITNTYGFLSAIVPIIGIAIFLLNLDVFGTRGNFHASILLSVIAWGILIFLIIPRQKSTLRALQAGSANRVDMVSEKKKLSMFGGIFCLLWLVTAILMFF